MAEDSDRLRELVADVAAAYFSNSNVGPAEISAVVQQIAASLQAVQAGAAGAAAPAAPAQPEQQKLTAAQIRKSISPDALISFEDNKSYKTLRRHLTGRGLTPEQYRQKWGLPADYPMVSPSYSEKRSNLAKTMGFGQSRGKKAAAAPAKAAKAPKAPKASKAAKAPKAPKAAKAPKAPKAVKAPKPPKAAKAPGAAPAKRGRKPKTA